MFSVGHVLVPDPTFFICCVSPEPLPQPPPGGLRPRLPRGEAFGAAPAEAAPELDGLDGESGESGEQAPNKKAQEER